MKKIFALLLMFSATISTAYPLYHAKLDRSLFLNGPIEHDSVEEIQVKLGILASTDKSPISLFISSTGGSVKAARKLSETIIAVETLGVKVICIAEHVVQSAAFGIFAACTHRIAVTSTTFMFHYYRVKPNMALTVDMAKFVHLILVKYKYELEETLQKSMGMSAKSLIKALEQEEEWSAAELQREVKPGWMILVSGVRFL